MRMFTICAVDDASITLRSSDPATVGRVLRMLDVEWQAPHRAKPEVFVTIYAPALDEEISHAKITIDPSPEAVEQSEFSLGFDELPF